MSTENFTAPKTVSALRTALVGTPGISKIRRNKAAMVDAWLAKALTGAFGDEAAVFAANQQDDDDEGSFEQALNVPQTVEPVLAAGPALTLVAAIGELGGTPVSTLQDEYDAEGERLKELEFKRCEQEEEREEAIQAAEAAAVAAAVAAGDTVLGVFSGPLGPIVEVELPKLAPVVSPVAPVAPESPTVNPGLAHMTTGYTEPEPIVSALLGMVEDRVRKECKSGDDAAELNEMHIMFAVIKEQVEALVYQAGGPALASRKGIYSAMRWYYASSYVPNAQYHLKAAGVLAGS